MDKVIDSVKQLMSLVEHRVKMYDACTQKILRRLDPTLLSTIRTMFGSNEEQCVFKDVFVQDNVVAVSLTISYKSNQPMTPFLQLLHTNAPPLPSNTEIQRSVVINIPIEVAFSTTEEIETQLMEMARGTYIPPKPSDKIDTTQEIGSFDPSHLSEEQVSQMLFFQQQTKGIKQ